MPKVDPLGLDLKSLGIDNIRSSSGGGTIDLQLGTITVNEQVRATVPNTFDKVVMSLHPFCLGRKGVQLNNLYLWVNSKEDL
jgi:hypothetical protein